MTTYTRVRYQPVGGKPRNVILQDAVEAGAVKFAPTARFLTGLECDHEGNDVFDTAQVAS